MLENTDRDLLYTISDIKYIPPETAYNIRKNGQGIERRNTKDIEIISKTDKPGIDIRVKSGSVGQTVYIPVIVTETGVNDKVYNDFYIGDGASVTIVAGCGIHNSGCQESRHDGIHRFFIGKGAHVKYVEKHYGEGEGTGARVLNPTTEVYIDDNGSCEMETVQIKGVDSTVRETIAELKSNAKFNVTERIMTHGKQHAESNMKISLNGEGATARIVSRSVAKDESSQIFHPTAVGNAKCAAHVQCDSIIMDRAKIKSIPAIEANDEYAQIVHEAAIGRINNEQLLKLMTFGLTPEKAEEVIIEGFLK
jgi:uncharacterized protein